MTKDDLLGNSTIPGQLDEIKYEVKKLIRAVDQIPGDLSRRLQAVETSVEQRKVVMRETIVEAIQDAMPRAVATEDHIRWINLSMDREAQLYKYRKAVIEKTLTGLAWASIVGLAVIIREWLNSKGFTI